MRNNKKGYTLAELVAVLAILMILAIGSTPFVRGYIHDANNAKARAALREIYEAKRNFETDYKGTVIAGDVPVALKQDDSTSCQEQVRNIIRDKEKDGDPKVLITCGYLRNLGAFLVKKDKMDIPMYDFYIGEENCSKKGGGVVCMIGSDLAGEDYAFSEGYRAYIDEDGVEKICTKSKPC